MKSKRQRSITRKVLNATALLIAMTGSSVYAADILPMSAVSANSSGKVSSGRIMKKGTIETGMSFDGADEVKIEGISKDNLLSSGHQSSISFDYGFSKNLQLGFNVKSTYEIYKPEYRQEIHEADIHHLNDKEKVHELSYAGTRVHLKYRLLRHRGLNVSVMPFVEEGLGEKGKYSLTRNQKSRSGWLLMTSYGKRGVGEVSLNAGMRYREPELLGNSYIRNEMMARLSVKAYVSRNASVFSTYGGRRLYTASINDQKNYTAQDRSEVLAGISYRTSSLTMSAYGGTGIKEDETLGFGRNTYGLSIATLIGGKKKPHKWLNRRIVRKSKVKKISPKTKKSNPDYRNIYPEMTADSEIDYNVGSGNDDFSTALKKLKRKTSKRKKTQSTKSYQDRVEEELAQIRAAEEKLQKDQERRAELQRKRNYAKEKKLRAQEKKRLKKYRNKIRKELDSRYSFTVDDLEWDGLE